MLLAGVYLATDGELWSEVWVVVPLVLLFVIAGLGVTVLRRGEERLVATAEAGNEPAYAEALKTLRLWTGITPRADRRGDILHGGGGRRLSHPRDGDLHRRARTQLSLGGVTTATAALETSQRRRRGQIYVALAAVAWSTAGVLQRQLTLDTSTQVFGRAVFAAGALLAYVAVVERGRVAQAFRSVGVAGVAVALCVATAAGSFIAALNHASVARVLFILAVSPVLAALLARVTLGEPITRRTALAMALALVGVTVMLGAPGEGSLAGDGLAFLAALSFAVMVVITRWRHDVSMAPATCLSQVILVVAFLPFASPGEIAGDDVGWLAALGIGQIGLGFALLTVGARLIPAAQVGLITLLEVVLGPLWVWLALDERPSTLTLVGGAIVIAAIVMQTREAPPPEPDEEPALPAPH